MTKRWEKLSDFDIHWSMFTCICVRFTITIGRLGHLPIQTYGDGNCLYRAMSRTLCGDENMHVELRVWAFIELCIDKSQYLSDAFLKQLTGLENCIDKLFNSNFDTSSIAKNKDKERYRESFEVGILNTIKLWNTQICGIYLHSALLLDAL